MILRYVTDDIDGYKVWLHMTQIKICRHGIIRYVIDDTGQCRGG